MQTKYSPYRPLSISIRWKCISLYHDWAEEELNRYSCLETGTRVEDLK